MGGCSAPNCTNSSRKGFRMFMFPKDPMRKKQWVLNCNRDGVLRLRHACLCEAHFEPDQFESKRVDGWKKLKPCAVPTLFDLSGLEKAYIRQKSPSKQTKVLGTSSDHTYSESKSDREESGEYASSWKFGFSSDLQVEDQAEEHVQGEERPVQGEEAKRPEIVVLKPSDVVQTEHIMPDIVSLFKSLNTSSPLDSVENEHKSMVGDESSRNPPLENCEPSGTTLQPLSSTVEPNIVCVQKNIDSSVSTDLTMFHLMAAFIRENRPNHTTFTVTNVLICACVKFNVSIQFLCQVYPCEHFSGQKLVYSCAVKIKDILVSEDVSRDREEAHSRAVKIAYDTILSHPLCIEVNENGVLCLKRVQKRPHQNPPAVPLAYPPTGPKRKGKKKRSIKTNLPMYTPIKKKKIKKMWMKVNKAALKNVISEPNQKSKKAKLVPFEQTISGMENCNVDIPPKGKGKVVYLAENVDLIPAAPLPKFVIYDNSEVTNVHCDFSTLTLSATLCNAPVKFQYRIYSVGGPCIENCEIYIKDQLVCQAIARSKKDARTSASVGLLQALKKKFYTIKEKKVQSENFVITLDQFNGGLSNGIFALSEKNIGCKLLKTMGWSGGGIGKMGDGITEPIRADATYIHKRGLGFSNEGTLNRDFHVKVDSILKEYVALNSTRDLIFSSEFTEAQKQKIQFQAQKYFLKVAPRVVENGKEIVISRKYPVREIFNILKNGGSMDKYELIPPDDTPKDL